MFLISKVVKKTVSNPLTGKEFKRVANCSIPQYGPSELHGKTEPKYTDEDCSAAFTELHSFLGADNLMRFLNWAVVTRAQREAQNDLRGVTGGLSEQDADYVKLILRKAQNEAELESTPGADGKIDVKSAEYIKLVSDSVNAILAKPKFAHLKGAFEVSETPLDLDYSKPGKLYDVATAAKEEQEADSENEKA